MKITTIGLDLAKHWFQVHGIGSDGQVAVRRRLRRSEVHAYFQALEPCLVGMEACATAHHWARELIALGHTVKLMPPAYVKAYVKRNKNDAADAEAICEAVTRPSMRFVPMKSAEQQAVLMLHRARHHGRDRDRRHRHRPLAVPLGPGVRGLARHDAAAEFQRRQGTSGPHQQARRQIHPLPAGIRRGRGAAAHPQSNHQGCGLGARAAGPAPCQGRRRGAGQQGCQRRFNFPHLCWSKIPQFGFGDQPLVGSALLSFGGRPRRGGEGTTGGMGRVRIASGTSSACWRRR